MKEEVQKAADIIKNGGVILYPTDTIWGLGCDPKNEAAIEKIRKIKNRPLEKSLIMLVHNEQLLTRYVKEIPEVCFDLIDCATKPLTIIYPKGQYVSDKVLGPDQSIAIRLTKDDFCTQLISKLKHGLISTSANISNEPNPSNFNDISESIKEQVDYVVNLPDRSTTNIASQIIKIEANSEIQIIRK